MALGCLLLVALLRAASAHDAAPDTVSFCCEGDVLFLLDSSGSVSSYEFSRMLAFLSELLHPFSLGSGQVRVGLMQVSTSPHLEFGFEVHSTQQSLQESLQNTRQLKGDTNTVEALRLAQHQILEPGAPSGARPGVPRVVVWVTDGVQPGPVEGPMAELRQDGVAVLVVSTGYSNYQVLRQVVTPPTDTHLYFVDIDDISIITKDLRDAIIELIRADRLQVRDVSSHSAILEWRPILTAGTGSYEVRFGQVWTPQGPTDSHVGTSLVTSPTQYSRITLSGDASWVPLEDLQPNTKYIATLIPHTNLEVLKSLNVTFTTHPEVLSPAVVTVSEVGTRSARLTWGPLQPNLVQQYRVEYSVLPGGVVQVVTANQHQNSTVLTGLQPDMQYLVTVVALHTSGLERAMSIKICTEEELLALADLQLTTVGSATVQVHWRGRTEGVQGYWVSWERGQHGHGSLYLPPSSLSTLLTNVAPASRICVSPVYRTARGDGLCCTAQFYSSTYIRAVYFLQVLVYTYVQIQAALFAAKRNLFVLFTHMLQMLHPGIMAIIAALELKRQCVEWRAAGQVKKRSLGTPQLEQQKKPAPVPQNHRLD
ncbi:von Willebrand factor A domain-containing protein 1 [Arapaima gigas]